jgi:hypothetical protein
MAVTTTVQQILDAAYAKSLKNRPGTIATESTELLQVVQRALNGIYALAARINPLFFASSSNVTLAAGSWARPETAESIFRIEGGTVAPTTPAVATGAEVVVVPFDDRQAESGKPAVYRYGQKFFTAGNASDPVNNDLMFYYSKRPSTLSALTSTLDAMWTEQFNELLVLEVAIYLALKDTRGDEIGVLSQDRDRWANQFMAFLEHEVAIERRRHGHIRRFNTETLVPLNRLLAGGNAAVG